ncbi:hypothetical protein [Novosphingobium malaysiense]|uniref:Uncharacterized protein n=1 Tax=Novosphingobium malaysiense TaxID=1348853 RepID=A0A0B1ZJN7_9SPHN|nr:hypothetical protein [Novosphingobium malaysiense]KHK89396.1 hypothetical protein LK12_19885 [Novosphingobium malaysiense]
MADSTPTGRAKWFWIIVILLLLVVLVVWLFSPSGDSNDVAVTAQATEDSSQWVEEPSGPKVPVDLPTSQ